MKCTCIISDSGSSGSIFSGSYSASNGDGGSPGMDYVKSLELFAAYVELEVVVEVEFYNYVARELEFVKFEEFFY
jgi:hypothetical protein